MSSVLIVDSNADNIRPLTSLIRELGHNVSIAGNLIDALQTASNVTRDVVVLDDAAIVADRLRTIGQLKEAPGKPEVIITTDAGDVDTAELVIRAGAWDYLCKHRSPADVVRSLERALAFRNQRLLQRRRPLNLQGVVGQSRVMCVCYEQLAQIAASDANVLITGDSGTGKELFARAIHDNSRRRQHPMIVVDCAALPPSLIESTLFGHRKGAFTGAIENRKGLIEQADGGTLFLDEIAELPLALQKTFLRALQERRVRPVGAPAELRSDFRVIAATNRDLNRMVACEQFRADLLFRLRTLTLHLPPLSQRGSDIRDIADQTVVEVCQRLGIPTKTVSPQFHDTLTAYAWPGNVRELKNAVEQAVAMAADHNMLHPAHLPTDIRVHAARAAVASGNAGGTTVRDRAALPSLKQYRSNATRQYLQDLMAAAHSRIGDACKLSGLSRSRLYALLKEHRLISQRHTSPDVVTVE